MSALLAIVAVAVLFAVFGGLHLLGGRIDCRGCPNEADPARCPGCPRGEETEPGREVEIDR